MKKISSIILTFVFITMTFTLFAQETKTDPISTTQQIDNVSVLSWSETTFDFGKIKHGESVTHEFKFTNIGKIPVLISTITASCGCTTPEWSKEPVTTGKSGIIKATFNGTGSGVFSKTILVNVNVENGYVHLILKGEVIE